MEGEVKALVEGALQVARDTVLANRAVHDGLASELEASERCVLST